MRTIGNFVRWLWQVSRASWQTLDPQLRPHSRASALLIFLFLLFGLVGLVLTLLGVDLADVDRWIDRQTDWLDALGSLAFNALGAAILLVSVLAAIGGLMQKLAAPAAPRASDENNPVGWGCIILAPLSAYAGWLMMTG